MSYSDIVGTISGVLQFVVACCALRVSRRFCVARVGWLFFGAFTLLAAVHVLVSVHPFGIKLELSPAINVVYEVISIFLLGTIVQVELLLWQHGRQREAEQQARAAEEAKAREQVAQLTRAGDEAKQTAVRLQAELDQQKQSHEQALAQMEKALQDQSAAAQQAEQASREIAANLEAELQQHRQNLQQLQAQAQQLAEQHAQLQAQSESQAQTAKACEEQLVVSRQTEEALRLIVTQLETEVAQHQQALEQARQAHQEQLAALRQSEDEWRTLANRLQLEAHQRQEAEAQISPQAETRETIQPEPEPQPEVETPAPESEPVDPLILFRQSGIAEVATMTQTRVAYLGRIAKLLRDHARDIGKFMTRTPQGKQLPSSLSLLIDYLSDEQFLLVKRIESIKKKFEQARQNGSSRPAAIPRKPAEAHSIIAEPETSQTSAPDRTTEDDSIDAPATSDTEESTTPDFRDLLIRSLTETGTEPATNDSAADETATPEGAELPSFDPGTTRL